MHYKIYCLLFFLCSLGGLSAQSALLPSVSARLSWTEACKKAVEEGKMIFVAVGINPTDRQARRLLSHPAVSSSLAKHTVGIAMDMDTEEGKEFEAKLQMYPWPAYAFFMPFGDLLAIADPEQAYKNHTLLTDKIREALLLAGIKRENSRTVRFDDGDIALQRSRAEGKTLFVYGYGRGDQASLLMEKNVFNLDTVADFYNAHFLCVKSDTLSSGQYPVYRFLNADGKRIWQAEGGLSAAQFIALGNLVLEKAQGTDFTSGVGRERLTALAAAQGKLIFSAPSLSLRDNDETPERRMYRDPELADYLNRHFINTAGGVWAAPSGVPSPFALFMDAAGVPIHWVSSPDITAEELLAEAVRAKNHRGVAALKERYAQGEKDLAFMEEYVGVLDRAGLDGDAEKAVAEFISGKSPQLLNGERYWNLFCRYAREVDSPWFDYLNRHKAIFDPLYGKENVDSAILKIWEAGARNFLRKEGDTYIFDKKGLKHYRKRLKKERVERWRYIIRDAGMYAAEKTGDWKMFTETAEEKWNEGNVPPDELYDWGAKINRQCTNPSLRYQAARWFAVELDRMELGKNTGKVSQTIYKGQFRLLLDELLK